MNCAASDHPIISDDKMRKNKKEKQSKKLLFFFRISLTRGRHTEIFSRVMIRTFFLVVLAFLADFEPDPHEQVDAS